MLEFLIRKNKGVSAILLALFLPLLISSIYFSMKFADRTAQYTQKDCSADAVLQAVKKYNFGMKFSDQKAYLLSVADSVYNDWTTKNNGTPIEYTTTSITYNKYATSSKNGQDYNQFISLYYSVDGAYRNNLFANTTHCSNCNYNTNNFKVANVLIPNNALNQNSYLELPFTTADITTYDEYPSKGLSYKPIAFKIKKSATGSNTTQIYKRKAESSIITLSKDTSSDKLTLRLTQPVSKEVYTASAVPAKCNVDIVLCIPTNSAACNASNLDEASPTANQAIATTTGALADISAAPIYQISQACKNFLANNFLNTQGACVALLPYSGKISLPHYYDIGAVALDFRVFNMLHCTNKTGANIINKAYGYELYGLCGDPKQRLDAFNYATCSESYPYWCNPWVRGHKYGFPLMYQRGPYDIDSKGFAVIKEPVDISKILSGYSNNDYNAFYIANMYPPYLGYTNFLRGKAEPGVDSHPASTEFQPNPYYMIPLTPDVLKICDLLECFRPINDPKNVSNFCFLPFVMSDYLLNYTAIGDITRSTSADYFSQDSKTKSGRNKAVIVFINKPDHFEPGELTFLGFSNDNNQFYLGESDCIKFNTDYSSTSYRFADGTTFASGSSGVATTTSSLAIKGTKKILRFKQTEGCLQRTGSTYSYYWTAPTGYITKATLKFPEKHLIKLVFEGNYLSSESSLTSGSVTFYSDNGVSDCRKDSSSGSQITLGSANTVSSATTFVFKGSSYPSAQQSAQKGLIDYAGPNFGLNVSPYKVRYNLSKAIITKAVLKNQVIRGYNGALYRSVDNISKPQFITSDGYKLTTTPYNMMAYGETAQDYTWSSLSSDQLKKFNRFNDACVQIADFTGGVFRLMNDTVPNTDWQSRFILAKSSAVLYMDFYGFTNAKWYASLYSGYWTTNIFEIGEQTGSSTYSSTNPSSISYTWDNPFTVLGNCNSTYYSNKLRMKITSGRSLSALYGMALMDVSGKKELYSTSTVSSSTLSTHMSNNSYIDLFYTSSNINNVPAGNWICFQGDGDLEVTVEPNTSQNEGLAITNLKNTDGVTVITDDNSTFPKRKIVYIETTSIPDDKDSDGDYHLDLAMSGVKLVSAEITNRTYQKVTPTVTYSTTSTTKADDKVTTEDTTSYTKTTTVTGDTTRVYKITSNTDRPLVVTLSADRIATTTQKKPKTTVTFYSSNGVTSCKLNSSSGSTVKLDSPYTISGTTTFFFDGHKYSTATQASNYSVSSFTGPNFGLNVSPYKVRYSLNNTKISTVTLKNQALRAYNGCISRGYVDIPYQILRNGKKLTEPPFHMGALGNYTAETTDYTWSSFTAQQLSDFNQFNDRCVSIASCTAPYRLCPDTKRNDTHTQFPLINNTSEQVTIEFAGLTSGKWYASIHSGYRETNLFHIGVQTGSNSFAYDTSNIRHDWLTPFIILDDFSSTYYSDKVRIRTYCGRKVCSIYNMTVANYSQTKSLYSASTVSSSTLDTHMAANSYVDLFNTSSSINDTPAGNWICFQGDGDLYVTVAPTSSTLKYTQYSYNSSYTKQYARGIYQENGSNFPYLFYKTGSGATESTTSCSEGTTITISPNNTTFTRDSNGNYVYTLTLKNAQISSAKFYENASNSSVDMSKYPSFIFPDPGTTANNRNISLYKTKSYDSDLTALSLNFNLTFFSERLYPYVSYSSNSTYDISGSYGNIYPLKYHADGTLILNPFSEATCFTRLFTTLYPEYTTTKDYIYIPGCTRIFSQFSRKTPDYSRFYLDNYANSSRIPYSSWFEVQGVHFTLPDNYALTSYLYHHPEDTPSDKYDQDAILRKVTQRCASTLKNKSNTKIYIIKFRKQDQYKTFPLYNPSGTTSGTDTDWDYSYLDSCANNIYECSSEEDLKSTLETIAKQIKNDAGYDDAHCI